MGISHFVHLHGDPTHAAALCNKAQTALGLLAGALPKGAAALLHAPLAVPGRDPLPVAQDARMLLCQLYFEHDDALESGTLSARIAECFSRLRASEGVRDVHSHVMTTEHLKPGNPNEPDAPADAVSFFVQYDGPAKDPAAFHAYYRAHHVPIVFRMPGIRSVAYHLPTPIAGPVVGTSVARLQIVQAVFSSAEDFLNMRQSAERQEGLRDFANYPPFEGPVTHQVMQSRRLG